MYPVSCYLLIAIAIIGNLNGVIGEAVQRNAINILGRNDHHQRQPPNALPAIPIQSYLRRAKRSEQSEDTGVGEEESKCTVVPPRPPKSTSPQIPIDFITLLNNGSKYMSGDADVKEAILMVGNTGAGKSTLTQILAGDLSRTHAVLTGSGRLVIVDDDNRIGAPTTISKTLIPELVLKQYGEDEEKNSYTKTAFYDCPGFDDTRGVDKDIAANFFMNHIVKKINRIKMLFVVIQSSVKRGNDRLDFDLLATHATKFVKNIQNYDKSIGLVVTKVDNFNFGGRFISDESILKEIVEFLQDYNNTLHSQLDSDSPVPVTELKKKINFVRILLDTNEEGNFHRISFSRNPDKCGPLSKSKIVTETRRKVTQLYAEQLDYSPVNSEDFGYTLKYKTRLKLGAYLAPLNQQVATEMTLLMNNFSKWYHNKYLQAKDDVRLITGELHKSTNLMKSLTTSLSGLDEPQQILDVLKPAIKTLGFYVPPEYEKFMTTHQAYYDFFDEVNAARLNRTVREWIAPVEMAKNELVDYYEWYEFCGNLQSTMEKYGFQLSKPKVAMEQVGWLNVIEKDCKIPVSKRIRALSASLETSHLQVLEKIAKFTLRPISVDCRGSRVRITGNYIPLSEFISKGRPIIRQCNAAKHIEVYAAHTLFIDRDVDAVGMELNLVMIAPNWVVPGENALINLNGSPAPSHERTMAISGQNGVGQGGWHGLAGKPGGPGGSFFGLGYRTTGISKLTITSRGGNGGDGQNGGNGGTGAKGTDATVQEAKSASSHARDHNAIVVVFNSFTDRYRHVGHPGKSGGDGGSGGVPGEGGKPGSIKFFVIENKSALPTIINRYGEPGRPGYGGKGGAGGAHGVGMFCQKTIKTYFVVPTTSWECETHEYPESSTTGPDGRNGVKGASSVNYFNSRNPTRTIVEMESISNYMQNTSPAFDTKDFFKFLDKSPAI